MIAAYLRLLFLLPLLSSYFVLSFSLTHTHTHSTTVSVPSSSSYRFSLIFCASHIYLSTKGKPSTTTTRSLNSILTCTTWIWYSVRAVYKCVFMAIKPFVWHRLNHHRYAMIATEINTHTPTEISRANKNNKAAKKEKGGNIFMWKRLLHCRSVVIHRLSIFYGWLGTGAIVFITFQMAISERVSIYCFVYLLAFFLFYQENATNYKEFMCSSPLSNVAIHFASAVYLSRGFFFCHMLADVKQNKILSQFTALYILQ